MQPRSTTAKDALRRNFESGKAVQELYPLNCSEYVVRRWPREKYTCEMCSKELAIGGIKKATTVNDRNLCLTFSQ